MYVLVEDAPVEQPRKKNRYDQDVITVEDVVFNGYKNLPVLWLSLNHIDLSTDDKEIVVEGKQLTNKHINYAQAILKKHFDQLSRLHSTLFLSKLANALVSNDVQVIHSRTNH